MNKNKHSRRVYSEKKEGQHHLKTRAKGDSGYKESSNPADLKLANKNMKATIKMMEMAKEAGKKEGRLSAMKEELDNLYYIWDECFTARAYSPIFKNIITNRIEHLKKEIGEMEHDEI